MKRNAHTGAVFIVLSILLSSCEKSLLDTYSFPDGKVYFSALPLDISGARWFVPMGEANVVPKDHGGFLLLHAFSFPPKTAVLAVADGVLILASHGRRTVPSIPGIPMALWGMEYDDHLLELKISKDIIVNYAHITAFHPDIMIKIGNLPVDETGHPIEVEVHAGDTLGFVDTHGAMDFSVSDFSLDLSFENPSRYPGNHIYSADIYNYFEGSLLDQMEAIAIRDDPPYGGKIDYDIKGRISGNWFLEGTTSFIQWSRQLCIVYHHIYSNRVVISDGTPMNDVPGIEDPGRPDVYFVKGNMPLPADIGQNQGMIKYTLIPIQDPSSPGYNENNQPILGEVLIRVLEEGKIKVEFFKGELAPPDFTSAAKIYTR